MIVIGAVLIFGCAQEGTVEESELDPADGQETIGPAEFDAQAHLDVLNANVNAVAAALDNVSDLDMADASEEEIVQGIEACEAAVQDARNSMDDSIGTDLQTAANAYMDAVMTLCTDGLRPMAGAFATPDAEWTEEHNNMYNDVYAAPFNDVRAAKKAFDTIATEYATANDLIL